jgi:single-stranded DNA-specific DHH superfamily exonuclease
MNVRELANKERKRMETEVLLKALERAAEAEENIALKMLLVLSKEKIEHLEHVIEMLT